MVIVNEALFEKRVRWFVVEGSWHLSEGSSIQNVPPTCTVVLGVVRRNFQKHLAFDVVHGMVVEKVVVAVVVVNWQAVTVGAVGAIEVPGSGQ